MVDELQVAVKVLSDMSPENSYALWKEARVMQMYDHPHVVRMYGVANDTEPYYLVMELVSGGALNDFLKKKGKHAKTSKRVQVAVKVLSDMSPENSYALWKEARVMQMYDHPHVVRMYGVANDTEPYYLVMELVSGGALNDFLKKKGRHAKTSKRVQVYQNVVDGTYRLSPQDIMPTDVASLFRECIAEPQLRPTFKSIVLFLKACLKESTAEEQ
ncbi:hypothetical protein NECAME_03810 [Necator americanus]|uniref:Protein kinase domain-containing protein n=1 Tax=Necator americanus TaxID=51031 RepID=W2T280_NECAM|nr:hypothetical protein NECAME_03810 [Necator americanus]ETN75087.1 hypothetical protein NECAME_03810 [Necator americanus]